MATIQTPVSKEILAGDAHSQGGTSRVAYRIGGISFAMFSENRNVALALDPGLRDFALDTTSAQKCDINIHVSLVDKISIPKHQPLFHSGGLWSLFEERFEHHDGYRLNFQRSFPGETPYKSVWFDRNFETGHLLLSRKFFKDAAPVYPLEYPLDEVLMIHRLACGYGLEV
ncbi:MAG: hypothetical protein ABLQ96_05315, partial [Candidatus Acidiferrum sp.]